MSDKVKDQTSYLVGVYGTLKVGFGNHPHYMEGFGAEFEGYGTLSGTMIDLGAFPGVIPGADKMSIQVEVYKVSKACLDALDSLESNGRFYTRAVFPMAVSLTPVSNKGNLPLQHVWVYTLPEEYLQGSCNVVTNGFWEGPDKGPRLRVRNKVGDIRKKAPYDEIPMNADDKKITPETTVFTPLLPAPKPEVWIFPETMSFEKYMEANGGVNHAKAS